jgi:hypothetical protein
MPFVLLYQQKPFVSRFAVSVFFAHIESPISKLGDSFFLLLRAHAAPTPPAPFATFHRVAIAETVNTRFAIWENQQANRATDTRFSVDRKSH